MRLPPSIWKSRILYQHVILIIIIHVTQSATVVSYDESDVWTYLRMLPRENVSTRCASSLDRVETYLTDRSTLEEERQFFYQSCKCFKLD